MLLSLINISVYIERQGYSGGIRGWADSVPMTFDRKTGTVLILADLFNVDRTHYLKKLTAAIYKYMEMNHLDMDSWGSFDSNPLKASFNDNTFALTDSGILICCDRYTLFSGASGAPKFEIPYNYLKDILKY